MTINKLATDLIASGLIGRVGSNNEAQEFASATSIASFSHLGITSFNVVPCRNKQS